MYYTSGTRNSPRLEDLNAGDSLDLLIPYHLLIDLRSKNEVKFEKIETHILDSNSHNFQTHANSEDDLMKYRAVNRAFERVII